MRELRVMAEASDQCGSPGTAVRGIQTTQYWAFSPWYSESSVLRRRSGAGLPHRRGRIGLGRIGRLLHRSRGLLPRWLRRIRIVSMSPHYAARRRERDRELPRALCARFLPVTLPLERELRPLFPRTLVLRPEREREERELLARRAPERFRRRELPRAEDAERR